MLFAIRDDDVNFFTQPHELEFAYDNVWGIVPPTFSIISHVKGNWNYWAQEISKFKKEIDWNAWRLDDKVYPFGDNKLLVSFLNEKLSQQKLDVSFHAIHHRNEDPKLPADRANNYVQGAEFFTSRNLSQPLRDAIVYVENNIRRKISVFTPPQNLMSMQGYRAVVDYRLSIVGSGIPFWKKELNTQGLLNIGRIMLFKISHINEDYPFVLHFKNHSEVVHHYPLHPTTRVVDLVENFKHVHEMGGDFVLSTHYHEFNTPLSYDSGGTMKDVFTTFMEYVFKQPGVVFCTLTEMCSLGYKKNR